MDGVRSPDPDFVPQPTLGDRPDMPGENRGDAEKTAGPVDRSVLRAAYRWDEDACIADRLVEAAIDPRHGPEIAALATRLVTGVRENRATGIDAFLHAYDLASDEGIALMCLAEALLRVPDARTADALIRDKLSGPDWLAGLDQGDTVFVNAAAFALMLTGKMLDQTQDARSGLRAALARAAGRLGEPVIRAAVTQAIGILSRQFVFGRTIGEALKQAETDRAKGWTHSFDMLGEGAKTFEDAERYRQAYQDAVAHLAVAAADGGSILSAGISVKLSALHPRYDYAQAERARRDMLPGLSDLADQARCANIAFTIDAEEADRLELSMDMIEALVADDRLFAGGWQGFGLAVQAYQKRAVPLVDWVVELARRHRRRLMVRLVKGAYWDTEIKMAQVQGAADYPVFTRKTATDVSYLACARRLLAASDVIHPAFATHNAQTIAAIKILAGETPHEFQRLHGMGETLYEQLGRLEDAAGSPRTPVRIYAPVGSHKDLLAYLVRRLLENGANSSFVNRIADSAVPVADLARDPVAQLATLDIRRNPAIPLPAALFAPSRRNSRGIDLSDPLVREGLLNRLADLNGVCWRAGPTIHAGLKRPSRDIHAPQDAQDIVGRTMDSTLDDIADAAIAASAAQPAWCALGGPDRAERLERASDLLEENADALLSLCIREAGKTLPDAILELREAVDFLRYYAREAREKFAGPVGLPGPTGERNELRLAGRGVFAVISPWNFPLAIFLGQAAAALAAGNAVLAKPAEQTPLIAALAIDILHRAGIPRDVAQLLPGDGRMGAALVTDPRVAGVAFTGSTATAKSIHLALARRDGPILPLIAETGGQNAMIVDSSALPEQVTRDVIASAFQSAGQRCSALRILFVQDDVADTMIAMIAGAMRTLVIGDPGRINTDVGPVIDKAAKAALDAHVADLERTAKCLCRLDLPPGLRGHFVAPAMYELRDISELDREHFGPILHVIRYQADELPRVIADINHTGFGLTLGVHSRIESTWKLVERLARVGNLYVNRNQIGAVVGSQPFGGEGLSGTGPKAGGPNYCVRFATERTSCVDLSAAGGNAALIATA